MKRFLSLSLTVLAASTMASFFPVKKASANTFAEQQLNQQQLVAIAVPFGFKNHSLTIIEQIPGQQQCWQEYGDTPVAVDPLLLNFDFTDSCNRATDSNGYSIRIDGRDFSDYRLEIVEHNGELHLIATNPDPSKPKLFIGRTGGVVGNKNLTKIFLYPGWQITKRVYQGQPLGHFYLSGNSQALVQNGLIEQKNYNSNYQNSPRQEEYLEPVYGDLY